MTYYLPDGTTTTDVKRWARVQAEHKRVAEDTISDVWVSTVFLGLDHQWGDGPPLVYETMTFGAGSEVCRRYTTREQAEQGHADVCAMVRRTAWRWRLAKRLSSWSSWLAKKVGGEHFIGGGW